MAKKLHKGDRVSWKSHGTRIRGVVRKKITKNTDEAGRKVKASKDNPQYLVESSQTGATAVHKPKSLKKLKKKDK
jgi:hypothetical protein